VPVYLLMSQLVQIQVQSSTSASVIHLIIFIEFYLGIITIPGDFWTNRTQSLASSPHILIEETIKKINIQCEEGDKYCG
jgi:hypothetical protein